MLRIFYAYDRDRDAILLAGGDKTGNDRFYEEMIPKVEKIWEDYTIQRKKKPRREAENDEHE